MGGMPAAPAVALRPMTLTRRPVPVDAAALDDADLSHLNDHLNRIRLEADPDFPPRPLAETRAWLTEVPGFIRHRAWWVRADTGRVIGFCQADAFEVEGNRHIVEVDVGVDPERRRQGLGTALVGAVIPFAREIGRRRLFLFTDSAVPSGEAFAGALGAEPGLREIVSRVAVADLDRELLRSWIAHAESHATDFELTWYDGPYPEQALPRMVELTRVMNDAPTEDLDMGDFDLSGGDLRDVERSFAARGIERWTAVAVHRPSGRAAGFTEIYWNPTIPHLAQQGDTGVHPDFRGHRLGKWMKAAMAERVLAERPQVTHIQTDNAGSNEPMLAINREMGFREHKKGIVWQIELDDLEARLTPDRAAQPS